MGLSELLGAAGKADTSKREGSVGKISPKSVNETVFNEDGTVDLDGLVQSLGEDNSKYYKRVNTMLNNLWKNPDIASESWLKKIVHYSALKVILSDTEHCDAMTIHTICKRTKYEKWELDSYDFSGPLTGRHIYTVGEMRGFVLSMEEDGVYLRGEKADTIRFGDMPENLKVYPNTNI